MGQGANLTFHWQESSWEGCPQNWDLVPFGAEGNRWGEDRSPDTSKD